MPSYVPTIPDGSANGRLIQLANTSTKLHDSTTATTHMDEVFIYVCNNHTSDVEVTIEVEGTGIESQIIDTIPSKSGFVLMVPGMRVQNTTDIDAKAGTTNVCNAMVIVNRILLTEAL